ncbi:MAG: hypothetical protein HOE90_20280, partial [Bacteriovoracaceae bacterium]|nr:hypothetical protein [Bacteriovoracaceae bacterium]
MAACNGGGGGGGGGGASLNNAPAPVNNSGGANSVSDIVGTSPTLANGVATATITISLADNSGYPVSGVVPTFTATDTLSTNSYGICSATNSIGVATCTMTTLKAENKILTITSPITKVGSNYIYFENDVGANLTFYNEPTGIETAGANFTVQPEIQILDSNFNPVLRSSTDVTISAFTDAACTVPVTGTFSTDNLTVSSSPLTGLSSFTNTYYTKAFETIYLKANAPGITDICSAGFTMTHNVANKLILTTQPSATSVAGVDFATAPTLEIRDFWDNLVTTTGDAILPITLTDYTDSGCTIAGTGTLSATANPQAAVAGVSTFTNVDYTKTGNLYLKVSNGALVTDCTTATLITPGPPDHLIVQTQPSAAATAGVALPTQPVIQGQDIYNNPTTNSTLAITLTDYTDVGCTVAGPGTITATSNPLNLDGVTGNASFTSFTEFTKGTIYLKATGSGVTDICTANIVVDNNSAVAANSTITGTSSHTADNLDSSTISIHLEDNWGNFVDGVVPVFSATNTNATNTHGVCGSTDSSGNTTCNLKSTYAETKTLYITSPMADTGTTVVFDPGPPTKVAYTTQPSGGVVAGYDLAVMPSVQVQDQYDNGIPSATDTITLDDFTDAGCTVAGPGTYSITTNPVNANGTTGTSTFAGINDTTKGNLYFEATAAGLTAACSTIIVVDNDVPIIGNSSISGTTPHTADNVDASTISINLQDQYTNPVEGMTPTFSATDTGTTNVYGTCSAGDANGDSSCTLKSTKAEVKTVQLDTPVVIVGNALTFDPGAPAKLAYKTQPSATGTAGVDLATQPVVEVWDAYNNLVPLATDSITLAAFSDSGCTAAGTGTFSVTTNPVPANGTDGSATFAGVDYTLSGNLYIKATSGALTMICSTVVAIDPNTPVNLAFFTQPPASAVAGDNFTTMPEVEIQDTYGNRVTTASSSINLEAHTNGTCSSAAGGAFGVTTSPLATSSGLSSYTGVNYDTEEVIYLRAYDGTYTEVCSTAVSVIPAPADHIEISAGGTQTITAGACSAVVTLQTRDQYGNITTNQSGGTTVTLSTDSAGGGGTDFYTDVGCTASAGGSVNIADLSSTTTIYYKDELAGTPTLTVTVAGFTTQNSDNTGFTIDPDVADHIEFSAGLAQTVTAGVCSAIITAQTKDQFGNITTDNPGNTTVTLSSDSTGTKDFYTDVGCTASAAGSIDILDTSSSETFYYKDTKAATPTLTTTVAAFTTQSSDNTIFTIDPDVSDHVTYATQPAATGVAAADLSTQPIVEVRDQYENVVDISSDTITLDAYTTADCSTTAALGTLSGNTMAASSGVSTFTGLDYTLAETIYLKASTGALTVDCSTAVVISPAAASELVITTEPSVTGTAGADLATQPVVEVRDAYTNVVTSSSDTVVLTPYTTADCSTTASTGTTNNGSKAASSGIATFTNVNHEKDEIIYYEVSSGGLTTDCTIASDITYAAAAVLAFSTEPSATGTAGVNLVTQPVVTVQDAFANTVLNAVDSITLAVFTDVGCTAAGGGAFNVTTNPLAATAGVSTFAGVNYDTAESIYIKASSGGLTTDCSTVVAISPNIADHIEISGGTTQTINAGACSAVMTFQTRDQYGNITTDQNGGPTTITLSTDSGGGGTTGFYTDSGCTTTASGSIQIADTSSTQTVYYTDEVQGTPLLTGTVAGFTTQGSDNTTFTINPAAADHIEFSAGLAQTVTAGVCSAIITVQTKDTFGNVTTNNPGNTSVVLTSDSTGTKDYYTDASCTSSASGSVTINDGTSSKNFYYKDTMAAGPQLTATVAGFTTQSVDNTIFTIDPAAAAQVAFTTEPAGTATAGADLSTQPVVTIQDSYANTIVLSSDNVTLAAFTDVGCTAAAGGALSATANPKAATAGVATFAAMNYDLAETIYLKASSGPLTVDCSTAIVVSPAAAAKVVYTTDPSATGTAGVDFAAQPVVEIRDAFENVVTTSSDTVVLSAFTTADCSTTTSTGTSNGISKAASSGISTFTALNHEKAESVYFKASSGGLTTDCSTVSAVDPAAATKVVYTTQPAATGTAGADLSTQPIVEVQDAFSNTVTSSSDTITIAGYTNVGCTAASGGTTNGGSKAAASGIATFTNLNHEKSENVYFKASTGGLTVACSNSVIISPAAAAVLAFTTEPSAAGTAGADLATQPVVTVQDAFLNTVTASSDSVTLAAFTDSGCTAGAGGALSVTTNPLAASSGVATFAGLDYDTVETVYLKASSGGLTTDCSANIVISPAAASQLVYTTQPSATGTAGVNLAAQPVIEIRDAFDNVATSSSDTVSLTTYTTADCSTTSSSGTTNGSSKAASSGIATFTALNHEKAEATYYKASSGGLTTDCSTISTISHAGAAQVVFSTEPSATGTAGVDLATQPVVTVQDAFANTVLSSSDSVTLAAFTDSGCTSAGGGTLSAITNPLAASSGVATFAGVDYTKAENMYLKASSGGLTVACSSVVDIDPAAADHLAVNTQPSTTGTAGADLSTQPIFDIEDTYNNLVDTATDNVTIAAYTDVGCTSAAGGTLNATANPKAASAGVATFASVDYDTSETIYLKATAGGMTAVCTGSIAVDPAAASQVVFTTEPAGTGTAGSNLSTQPIVEIRDPFDNVVSSTNTVTLTAYTDSGCTSASGGTFNGGTKAAVAGVATFTAVNHEKDETIYLKASEGGLTTDCSTAVDVTHATADYLSYTTEPSTTATAGADLSTQPVVTVYDTYANVVLSSSDSITLAAYTDSGCTSATGGTLGATTNPLSASSGVATFASVDYDTTETVYLKASSGGLTVDCSNNIVVSSAAAAKVVFATEPAGTGTAGSNLSTQPIVEIQDAFDNVVNSTNTVTLTAYTDSGCTAASGGTFNGGSKAAVAGVSTFTAVNHEKDEIIYLKAAEGGLTTDCSTAVDVSYAAADHLVFSTEPAASGTAGSNLGTQPVVTVEDAFNNTVLNSSLSITLADYTDSGCSSAGSGTLNATTNPLAASSGVTTFAGVNYTKTGNLYLKATGSGVTADCSSVVDIDPAAADHLAVNTQPSTTGTAGADLATQPIFDIEDTYNNLVDTATDNVTIAAYTNV